MMDAVTRRCSRADQAKGPPQFPPSRNMSAFAAMSIKRLGHDADVGDAGLLHRIHDRSESAERNVLVGAHVNWLVLGIANFLAQLGADLIDVHGIISQEHLLF